MYASSLTHSSPRSDRARSTGARSGKGFSRTARAGAAAAVAISTLGLTGAGPVSAAASYPASTATWRPGPAGVAGVTTAVTGVRAHGITTEFAFVFNYAAHHLYTRTNSRAWIRTSGPALAKNEMVVAAKAITAHHLVAFTVDLRTGASRVLDYKIGKWTVIGRFTAPIGSATVLSGGNIWVFGSSDFVTVRALGVWHYDGKSWRRVATSGTNGSGVTATTAWAVKGTTAEHYAGGKWTGTNLASLIPRGQIGFKSLIGIYAIPGSPVYAIGDGGNQDSGGPIVVLRFNGSRWTKVARFSYGNIRSNAVSSDGNGGLILGGSSGSAAPAELLHYANGSGKLVPESVPGMTNAMVSYFETAVNVPRTTVLIIGGERLSKIGNFQRATVYTTN